MPELLVNHPGALFGDFAGFIAYAKANPGKLNCSSAGNGTLPHVTMESLLRRFGVEVTHIPYRGAAPAMTDLLAGQVQLKMDTYATAAQHVASGRLRALAYAGAHRSRLMPICPRSPRWACPATRACCGWASWRPPATPKPVIERLATSAERATGDALLADRLQREGIEPIGGAPEEFATLIEEIAQWRELAKVGQHPARLTPPTSS